MEPSAPSSPIARRFRGFLPVVVDVETGGFNPATDALLEIAVVLLDLDAQGHLVRKETHAVHVQPFPGANIEKAALEVNGIRVDNPLRLALPEREALERVLKPVRTAVSDSGCSRALLVGHNAHFDLSFVNAACTRADYKRNPFHPFTVFDTATLAGAVLGQTVLKRALETAGLPYDAEAAHSAIYDTERTADLFCLLVNRLQPVYETFAASKDP
ncbi:MAG: ribonuclease T [Nevskiales bacterium]|nr:ribonuclease T [Nevskiales bacterium]